MMGWMAPLRHLGAKMLVVESPADGEPSMSEIRTIGLDLAKHIFQVHGVDAEGTTVLRKQLRRGQVLAFFSRLPPCVVGLEACATAHYWARELRVLGHEVRLMPAQYVKAYVKRNKNDAADAEAICEAVLRPTMRFVPVKTAEQQAALPLHRGRERLRFDFAHSKPMTSEEIKRVERWVQGAIDERIPVTSEVMSLREAQAKGAISLFTEKYGGQVSVYKIGQRSMELCGGPHVGNTEEIGRFKIQKEQSSSAGVRRIRAVIQ